MSWLDKFIVRTIAYLGASMPPEPALNFKGGGVVVADNPGTGSTDVTIAGSGAAAGTGFVHVTSSVTDGSARAVDLSSADTTGTLALARVAGPTGTGVAIVSAGSFAAAASIGASLQVLRTNAGATDVEWVAPSGGISALTGDVTASGSGSVAATVVKVNGITCTGTPSTGNCLRATSSSAAAWGALDLANASAVTGVLPTGNQAAQSCTGDVTGTTAATVVSAISGISPLPVAPVRVNWNENAGAPVLTQATATTGTGGSTMTIAAQQAKSGGGGAGGSLVLQGGAGDGAGVNGDVEIFSGALGGSGHTIAKFDYSSGIGGSARVNASNASGQLLFCGYSTSPTSAAAIYAGTNASSPSATNYSLYFETGETDLANPTLTGLIVNNKYLVANRASGVELFGGTAAGTDFGGGNQVLRIKECTTEPTGVLANAVGVWTKGGALKAIGTSGTITTIAPAEPHCPICGTDFTTEHESAKYGYLAICLVCLADELGDRPWIRRVKP